MKAKQWLAIPKDKRLKLLQNTAGEPVLFDTHEDLQLFKADVLSIPDQVFKQMDENKDIDVHVDITVNSRTYRMFIDADTYTCLEGLVRTIEEEM